MQPGLYIVATPIGNAEDITLRALRVLKSADVIACEDTRVTGKLATMHQIATPRLAYHEHNADKMRPRIMQRLRNGEIVALVSDAGTPLINDPGYKLVRDCVAEGLFVTALPGPSSVIDALVLSGLPSDRFLFVGYAPPKSAARRTWLAELATIPATLVMLESPKRLAAALADLADVLGPRPAAMAREMTKLFEEVRRAPLDELAAHYAEAGPPKGEVVLVIGPPEVSETATEDLDGLLRQAMQSQSLRDAAQAVSIATGMPRKTVYARALELQKDAP
ncbi:16S rRNA (cytidine(1402)-2'-O)-methyltransferase [Magnetospira thiophila]